MWTKSIGNAKKIFLSLLVFSSILYADTVDTVTSLSNISASVVKGIAVDGKSATESTSEAIAGVIVDKVSKTLLKKFVIDSGKLVLTEKQKVKILEEASRKMKVELLSKIKQVKGATPTIIADLVVGLVINKVAESVKGLINPQTPAEHFAAELASYGIKQAKVAWASRQGIHMAALEAATIAGEQVFEAVKLSQILEEMNKDNALQEAKNDAVFKANELRDSYKRAETQEEKQIIEKQILALFHSDNKDENFYLKGAARSFMDNLKESDKRKYFVINNLIEKIKKKSNPSKAELNHLKEFIKKQFNNNETEYFISMIPDIEDQNKNKLKRLSEKDKDLKNKIKIVNKKNNDLYEKELKKDEIKKDKTDAFHQMIASEKGSEAYYEYKDKYLSLRNEYKNISKDIDSLISSINSDNILVDQYQSYKNSLISEIVDTVDNYNNDIKENIAIDTNEKIYENYRGYITANIESKYDGYYADGSGIYGPKLRYWGGNFDHDLNDEPGGMELIVDSKTGIVTDIDANHGYNTSIDNSKDFSIKSNDISKDTSFYDPNIKTLKIENKAAYTTSFISYTTSDYSYTAWGTWAVNGGLKTIVNAGAYEEHIARFNNWIAGVPTKKLPTQGSAVYKGMVSGNWYTEGDLSSSNNRPSYGGNISGTMQMTVDFSNTEVVSGTLNLNKHNGSSFATATMDNMQMTTTYNAFEGKLIGANIISSDQNSSENMVKGRFYGPNAEEVGGVWNVKNTNNEFASGVFAGKR
jgi:hypothetical protein